MRIALVHYTAPPVIGGVERVLADQAGALRWLGHDVEIVTDRQRDLSDGCFDAVLVHNVFTMPFDLVWTQRLRAAASAGRTTRWINWVHDVAVVNPYYAHLPWQQEDHQMLKQAPQNCVHVVVSEVRRRDYAQATGLSAEDIQVIPNGLTVEAVLGLTERVAAMRLWRHDLVLFHPARLLRRKNIELGIAVCAELRARGCAAVYVVSGAPDPHQADGLRYFEELKALAGSADQVVFAGEDGALSDADVRSLYAMADCLFFPSKGEGFGLPLLEAALHRLPVFCSDLRVHREVLGSAGCYMDLEADPAEISKQIQDWMAQSTDVAARRRIWREFDMVKICQERLEPLLRIG